MWFYVCILLVVPQTIYMVDENDDTNGNTTDEEVEYGEVVKNISRVNEILEKLITNYEYLKKLYKSNETDDSDSSDDNSNVFKAQIDKENRQQTEVPEVHIKSTNKPRPENTKKEHKETFTNSEEEENIGNNDNNENNKINFNIKTGAGEIRLIQKDALKPRPRHAQLRHSFDNRNKKQAHRSNSHHLKQKGELKTRTDDKYEVLVPNSNAKKAEIIFMDSHNPRQKIIELEPKSIIRPRIKTKSKSDSKHSNYHRVAMTMHNSVEVNTVENPEKNVGKAEYFTHTTTRNQRYEVISNTPSFLRQGNMARYNKNNNDVNVNNDEEKSRNMSIVTSEKPTEEISETVDQDEDGGLSKEQFKTDVLRTAYDEACLKLIIRKCHKACKGAMKNVCRHFNCKSNFKNQFQVYEKRACIKEFGGEEPDATEKPVTTKDLKGKIRRSNDLLAKDAYLSAACFNSGTRRDGRGFNRRTNLTQSQSTSHSLADQNIKILRDNLEQACRKISASKCKKACHSASNQVCEERKCNKEMKSDFKKYCNRQCTSTFKLNDGSDKSSGSSGSSD